MRNIDNTCPSLEVNNIHLVTINTKNIKFLNCAIIFY